MLSVLTQFLSDLAQCVVVDGCRNNLVNLVSGFHHVSVFGYLLFIMYTSKLVSILEYKLYGSTDDYTLVALVPSLPDRVAVEDPLNRDLNYYGVSECVTFGE